MILDLFAGPGGWSEGLRSLGLSDVGIEWDDAACRTRAAAGHLTIRADVAAYPPAVFAGTVEGLIASPPCQDFSTSGPGGGRDGSRGRLIDEVPRWVTALRPRWIACEQVVPALDVWREFAAVCAELGYSTWAGVLNAADYGVPQSRRRAVLLASVDRPAHPPAPTHDAVPTMSLFGSSSPWVTLAEALPEHAGHVLRHNQADPARPQDADGRRPVRAADGTDYYFRFRSDRPAPTVTGQASSWAWEDGDGNTIGHLSSTEAAILQTFPADYPWQGGSAEARYQQIGNAVPPRLAAAVIGALTGTAIAERAA